MKNLAENFSTSLSQILRPSTFAMTDYSSGTFRSATPTTSYQSNGSQFKKFKRFFKNSPYIPFVVVGIVIVIIAVVVIGKAVNRNAQTRMAGSSATNTPVAIAKPLAQETLNKEFDFPLKDATGKEVSKIQYEIQSAELDNQIVVKEQIATAVQGRAFLILNLKITNNYDKSVQLNTRDYVRLVVDNASDKLAADVHNDPVDVEAISTKYTRLGFAIDSDAKDLKLEVGEIDGPKQTIQLDLK